MQRLKDLSPQELAALLGVTPRRAQEYLESADSIPFMQAPLEEVEQKFRSLHESGKLDKTPDDVAERWRQIRELLFRETEFEARYPTAYGILLSPYYPEITDELIGLTLPSFGVRMLRHEPKDYIGRKSMQDSYSDAYSVRSSDMEGKTTSADQSFKRLDFGYLRGVLLEILSRDEYWERIHTRPRQAELVEGLGAPTKSSVRITDLRLAVNLDADIFQDSLVSVLDHIQKPITQDRVVLWKQRVLHLDGAFLKHMSGDRNTKIATVAFAAAALLLFLDLRMPIVENASSYRLAEQVGYLAQIIGNLNADLERRAKKLETLLANRSRGHQARLDNEYYSALGKYRLGWSLKDVAKSLGINPYDSKTGKGTRDWEDKVREILVRAEEIERRKFPRAAAIFAHRDNDYVRIQARQAYYLSQEILSDPSNRFVPPTGRARWDWGGVKVGKKMGINTRTKRGREITKAYIELGFSLAHRVPPLT